MIRRVALSLALATCAALLGSCSKPGPGNVVMYFTTPDGSMLDGGIPLAMTIPGNTSWESSPWMGTDVHWLPYGAHVQLDLHHDLGRVPTGVITYLSFTEDGMDPSQAAGDLARIVTVDMDHVVVWNDTNGIYFARVVVF